MTDEDKVMLTIRKFIGETMAARDAFASAHARAVEERDDLARRLARAEDRAFAAETELAKARAALTPEADT